MAGSAPSSDDRSRTFPSGSSTIAVTGRGDALVATTRRDIRADEGDLLAGLTGMQQDGLRRALASALDRRA